MSFSMWCWRVLVPGAGLTACAVVLWFSFAGDTAPARLLDRPSAPPTPSPNNAHPGRVLAEGRLAARPGAEIVVSSERGGTIVQLPAREKAKVHKGDLLLEFSSDDQRAALAEADARLAEADADFQLQKRTYLRRVRAAIDNADLLSQLDVIGHEFVIAGIRLKAAHAGADQARASVARTRIVAPIDGTVTACDVHAGEVVAPGTRLLTVCDLTQTWIEAEVDEFDAPRVAEGSAAVVTAEGYVSASWAGRVAEIPDRVAERSLRPDDPGRPSDTRVLLVKISLDAPTPLRLGQQVEVEIRTHP